MNLFLVKVERIFSRIDKMGSDPWKSQLNFFFQAQTRTNLYHKMVHYHKKNNHNVSNFLGLKTARKIKSRIDLATTKILFGQFVAIVMDTNDPADVAPVAP